MFLDGEAARLATENPSSYTDKGDDNDDEKKEEEEGKAVGDAASSATKRGPVASRSGMNHSRIVGVGRGQSLSFWSKRNIAILLF